MTYLYLINIGARSKFLKSYLQSLGFISYPQQKKYLCIILALQLILWKNSRQSVAALE